MITGYNNDIQHRGTVFHVQTEDKGEASAWIESLIYTGGRILARKRVTYKQLLDEGADKPAIAKLMERQHRLMIHQIREGRFDGDTSDGIAVGPTQPSEDDAKIHTTRIQQQAEAMFGPEEISIAAELADESSAGPADEVEPPPAAEAEAPEEEGEAPEAIAQPEGAEVEARAAEGEVEPGQDTELEASEPERGVVEEGPEEPPSDEIPAPEIPPPPSSEEPAPDEPLAAAEEDEEVELEVGPAPTLDQVIFDYLSSVAQEESLVLLMDESPALATGTTTRMDLGTHASRSGQPIASAVIAVRMISKTGGPVTLAEGTTDEEGTLQLVVEVPEVERDSAALIITAASSIGNAEIKHLL